MVAFAEVLDYLREIYPRSSDFNIDRAMLTLYLIDWKAAIDLRRPVTDLEWRIEHVPQPTVAQREVMLSALQHEPTCALAGNMGEMTAEDRAIIHDIVARVGSKSKTELLRLVYSTFPVLSQPRHAPINLVSMADKYKREYRDGIS